MITITKKLDMSPHGIPQVIHVSQYDSDFSIQFKLYASVGTLSIESGTTAEIRGTKGSGTGYSASATLDTSNGTVTVAGSEQMTAVAGRNTFEIVLKKSGKVLGSANFILLVERAALDADTITDASVLRELNAIVEGAETATQAAEDAEDAADRAEAAAESLVIDSTPTQGSAHAVSSGGVYEAVTELDEKLDEVTEKIGVSYEPIEIEFGSHTVSDRGLTFTTNPDGTVRVSGTNTGSIRGLYQPRKPDGTKITFELTAGKTYRLTGCPSGGGGDTYELDIRKAASGGGLFHDYGSGAVFTATETTEYIFTIAIGVGQTVDITFTPQLEEQVGAGRLCAVDSVAREEISKIHPGLSAEAKRALLACFENIIWKNANGVTYVDELRTALEISDRRPELPSAYEQVEFIKGSGTQYINTGILSQIPFRAEVKLSYSRLETRVLSGTTSATGNTRFFLFGYGYFGSGNRIGSRFGDNGWMFDSDFVPSIDTPYELSSGINHEANNKASVFLTGEGMSASATINVPTVGNPITIMKFAGETECAIGVALYEIRLYSSDTLLFDGIPY